MNISSIIRLGNREFIAACYDALLDRGVDSVGLEFYSNRLRNGYGKLDVIMEIYSSTECKKTIFEL